MLLLGGGFLPVLCLHLDGRGRQRALNINADTAAFALAAHLAGAPWCSSPTSPGSCRDGSVVQALSAAEARALVDRGVINGGMVPKVTASLDAMDKGVRKVIIGQYEGAGSLARLLEGKARNKDYGNEE